MGKFIAKRKHNHDIQCDVIKEFGQMNTNVDFPQMLRVEQWYDRGVARGGARLYFRQMYEETKGEGNWLAGRALGLGVAQIDYIVTHAEQIKAALNSVIKENENG